MPKRRAPGLGRGLSALLGDVDAIRATSDGVLTISVGHIFPDPDQPRRNFDDDQLDELAASIAVHGIIQPIVVRPTGGGGYRIVAGERRWRAAQRAGLHDVPVIVRDVDEANVLELALLENIQRADLNAIEEGMAYARLMSDFGHTQEALGKIVHKSRSHVANLVRLLDLPESVRSKVASGQLSMGHARAILSAPNPEAIALEVVEKDLSVRAVEQLIKRGKSKAADKRGVALPVDADVEMLQRQLGDLLGLNIAIKHHHGSGSLTLHYASLDQLDMICQRLSGEKI